MKNPKGKQKWGRGNEIRQTKVFFYMALLALKAVVCFIPPAWEWGCKKLYASGRKRSCLNWAHLLHLWEGEKGIIIPTPNFWSKTSKDKGTVKKIA